MCANNAGCVQWEEMSKTQNHKNELHIPVEDLPTWMRQARQNVDWGILVVIVFGLLVASPFLQPGLPRTNATENHVFIAADYAQAFREGRLYPRWSAAALNGYGAPIPNYYPPGTAYTSAMVELLFTDNSVIAVRLVYVLGLTLAGAMTYVFVMRWAGARAAILSSVLYMCCPYVGLTAPHVMGDLPGVLGLALLPTLLWSVHRLLFSNHAFDFALVALAACAHVVTVPKVLIPSGSLALVLSLWYMIKYHDKRRIFWVVFAGTMGVMLASFYWMPAVFEQEAIHWQRPSFVPVTYYLNLSELIQPFRGIDPGEMVVTPQFTVGIAGLVFTALGTAMMVLRRKHWGLHLIFGVCGVSTLLAGAIVQPEQTWLLGPAVWCLSIAGSAALHVREYLPKRLRFLLLPALLVLALCFSVQVWRVPTWSNSFGGSDPLDQVLFEQQGFGIAVLPPGMDIPVTLPDSAASDRVLINGYRSGNVVRVTESEFSPDSQITLITGGTHRDQYLIDMDSPTRLNILRSSFPGWQATLDNLPLVLLTNDESGLLQVDVPATSTGRLTISLETTPMRQASWILSWFSLGLLAVSVLLRLRIVPALVHDNRELISLAEVRLIALIWIGLVAGILLFVSPSAPYPKPNHALEDATEVHARTDAGLEVLAYNLDESVFGIGDSVEFFIAWRTSRSMLENYRVQVFLQDSLQSLRWHESELRYPGGYPTRRWRTNAYIRDEHSIELSPLLRPGDYQIAVEVYNCTIECSLSDRLRFFDTQGREIGPTLILSTPLTVTP